MTANWAADEIMCACISRSVANGDVLLEGIGAFLPTAGYELARLMHAPKTVSLSPIGSVFRTDSVPLSLVDYEAAMIARRLRQFSYGDVALRYLPAYLPGKRARWREFMRPAQVDRWGNTNNVIVGEYARPRVRLPGAVGIPDGTVLEHEILMYLPRHDPRGLVNRVDFVSSLGHRPSGPREAGRTGNPTVLVTDLGVFRFDREQGLVCVSLHPGVTSADVGRQSGFPVIMPSQLATTEPPTMDELELLRGTVDPLGLRRLEMVGGRERRQLLRQLLGSSR